MRRGEPVERSSQYRPWRSFWCLLAALLLSGCLAVNTLAGYSDRRQIIVFAAPASDSGKHVQRSIDTLRCQLAERDTDVRIVDITELPETDVTSNSEQSTAGGLLEELASLRGEGRPDFEVVLIGKDGGVKARTSDAGALDEFLTLIDTMPMRRAEMRSRASDRAGCADKD